MLSTLLLASLATAEIGNVGGGTLNIKWNDCGSSSTHGKVETLEPSSLTLGQKTTITGTGTVDEQVTDGQYELHMDAGIIKQTFQGDLCQAKTFNLPLGTGTISFDGMDCPLAVGTVEVPMEIQMSAFIPSWLASATITMKATDQSNGDLLCMSMQTSPAMDETKSAEVVENLTGGSLALTWSDCGDGSTHGKVTTLSPATLTLGQKTKITSTGTVDEQVTGGKYAMKVKAGFITKNYEGDICEASTFNLPLGLGSMTFDGMDCPVAAGSVSVPMEMQLSAIIPSALASSTITMTATDQSGANLLCVDMNAAPAAVEEEIVAPVYEFDDALTGGSLALTWSDCGDGSTHGKVTGMSPAALTLGQKTKITSTGTVDEQVTDGQYEMKVHAAFITQTFSGDICQPKTFSLPLGLGSMTFDGMDCPVAAGAVSVPIEMQLSGSIPSFLASATITMTATDQSGANLLCVGMTAAPQMMVFRF